MTVVKFSMPAQARAWDELLDPPLRFAPWPYEAAEVADIRKTLKEETSTPAVEAAIFAARWFLARTRLKERRKEPPKPDPHAELSRIHDAAAALKEAIKAASPQATRHLLELPSPGAGNRPLRPLDLLCVIEHFEHDNRFALRALPERDMIGRPEKPHEQRLIHTLRLAWERASGEQLRGWPAFRSACVGPLAKFGQLGLPARSDRTWEILLAAARKRFEGEVKSPN